MERKKSITTRATPREKNFQSNLRWRVLPCVLCGKPDRFARATVRGLYVQCHVCPITGAIIESQPHLHHEH